MADKNIRFKDKQGNFLYPKTKLGNIIDGEGNALDLSSFVTTTQLAEAIAGVDTVQKKVVQTLPAVADGNAKTIYFVPATATESGNLFIEYMLIDGKWEVVGTAGIDLSGYVTNAQLQDAYYDKTTIDQKLSGVEGCVLYDEV